MMKNAQNLKARLGSNMAESMGDVKPGAGGLPAGFAAPPVSTPVAPGSRTPWPSRSTGSFPTPNSLVRNSIQALEELAASLKARGQLQPVRVRWDGSIGKWIIIAGDAGIRAAKLAGLATLACIEARDAASNAGDVLEDQLVENCLREDLKPIEQARGLQDPDGAPELVISREWRISSTSPKGRSPRRWRSSTLRSRSWRWWSRDSGPIAAYEISRMDDADSQVELANRVISEQLTVQDAAAIVKADKLGIHGAILDPALERTAD